MNKFAINIVVISLLAVVFAFQMGKINALTERVRDNEYEIAFVRGLAERRELIEENLFRAFVSGDRQRVVYIDYKFGLPGSNPSYSLAQDMRVLGDNKVYLENDKGEVLDMFSLANIVEPGDYVQAWYATVADSGYKVPLSPDDQTPAYYWNSKTGLAVSITRGPASPFEVIVK